ncbi:MAG: hypothetical protein PHG06_00105 [Parabacteroides sp.]|nr:hypothetical protein [Parabacteroides sp.]
MLNLSHFSVFIWARSQYEGCLIGQYDTGSSERGWMIGTDQANEKRMRVLLSDNGEYTSHIKDYLTTVDVFDNQWHLYGFSWDAGTLRLDVDGIPKAVTKTFDASFTSIYDVSADVIVGARTISDTPAGFYTGLVGEYYLYNRSYSPSESSILYNETRRFYGK